MFLFLVFPLGFASFEFLSHATVLLPLFCYFLMVLGTITSGEGDGVTVHVDTRIKEVSWPTLSRHEMSRGEATCAPSGTREDLVRKILRRRPTRGCAAAEYAASGTLTSVRSGRRDYCAEYEVAIISH